MKVGGYGNEAGIKVRNPAQKSPDDCSMLTKGKIELVSEYST
jgi:hypothetical protein